MNISEIFSIENQKDTLNNGQIRYFQRNTCIIASVYGLAHTSLSRANEAGILEVSVKMEDKNDMQLQRYYEVQVRNVLEPIIKMEEYPNKILKLVFVIVGNNGSLLSSFINAGMITMMINGISLQKTIFSQEIMVTKQNECILYPTTEEEKENRIVNVILNVNSKEIYSLVNDQGINYKNLEKVIAYTQDNSTQITNFLKTYIYNNLQSQFQY